MEMDAETKARVDGVWAQLGIGARRGT
jgi:hypothetical protein